MKKVLRVTAAMVEDQIEQAFYAFLPDGVTTVCSLVLKNGYTVLGRSACADPSAFREDLGKEYSYQDAKGKIWQYLAYEIRSILSLIGDRTLPEDDALRGVGEPRLYVGSKALYAVPMDRGAYNALRGWEVPADEDASDEGYVVSYLDGGVGNVPGFSGYISWSPKAVFEQSYRAVDYSTPLAPPHVQRMQEEYSQLSARIDRLRQFTQAQAFLDLTSTEQARMKEQLFHMLNYQGVLELRLKP